MKFIVSSSQLLKQLQHISGVINANTVLPILEDFLFEVEKNKLTVVATDLETVMRIQLEIEAKESGKTNDFWGTKNSPLKSSLPPNCYVKQPFFPLRPVF